VFVGQVEATRFPIFAPITKPRSVKGDSGRKSSHYLPLFDPPPLWELVKTQAKYMWQFFEMSLGLSMLHTFDISRPSAKKNKTGTGLGLHAKRPHMYSTVVLQCYSTVECYWHCSDETVHYKSDKTVNFCGFICATTSPITVFINVVFFTFIVTIAGRPNKLNFTLHK